MFVYLVIPTDESVLNPHSVFDQQGWVVAEIHGQKKLFDFSFQNDWSCALQTASNSHYHLQWKTVISYIKSA